MHVTTLGALVALAVAIIAILRRVPPAYGMMLGAMVGACCGGLPLGQAVSLMEGGASALVPAVLRILSAGVLAGVLIESGAALSLAEAVVRWLGHRRALLALALATLMLTAAGVFIDVAVITVAPIALSIAGRTGLSRAAVLLAMVGGGKAGNVMSPNPNTIAVADSFHQPLTSVMLAGVMPGLCGLLVTYVLARRLSQWGSQVDPAEVAVHEHAVLPGFAVSLSAPLIALLLLSLHPLFGIKLDPLLALPAGGLAGLVLMGRWREGNRYIASGLRRMAPVAIMLLGTGCLAGVIRASALNQWLIDALTHAGLPAFLLAPAAGAAMSMATASSTAAAIVTSQVFQAPLLQMGVPALAAAAMINASSTVIDHMPHGPFFHASGGSVSAGIAEQLKLVPFQSVVGLTITIASTLLVGLLHWG
ncbi:GntP family permease [Frateuria aurantia]